MTLPDFLTLDDNGWIHVTDHRIGLEDIIFFYRRGDSPEMLHENFPTIDLATIVGVIAHYHQHQADVDKYVDDGLAECERLRAETLRTGPTLEELRQRYFQKFGRHHSFAVEP